MYAFDLALGFNFSEFVSEHILITATAYLSLMLTVALVLWSKFSELVHAVWTSVKNGIRDYWNFHDELRDRRDRRRPATGSP